jgi:hypothetical protein
MSERFLSRASVAAVLLVGAAALAGCRAEPPLENKGNAVANNIVAQEEPPKSEVPPQPVLDREALLLAAIRARSAAATGADDRAAQQPLDRQRFEFRMRLGCDILAPGAPDTVEARYDAQGRRVQLRAAPDVSIENPLVAAFGGEGVEAVEGFWIRRPWLLSSSCAGSASSAREFGIVQFFTAQEPRTERRDGRAYEIAAPLAEGASAPTAGSWDLVLRGRLRKWGRDRVVLCRSGGEGAAPTCVISVQFDEVSVEEVGTGRSLANWRRG